MRTMRFVVLVASLVAGLVATASASQTVHEVRYAVRDAFTRVVIDLEEASTYQVASHDNPPRISVNIRGARGANTLQARMLPQNDSVRRVRVNRLSWGVQVVLDLHREGTVKHFTLPKAGNKRHRIVLDVYGGDDTEVARAEFEPPAPQASSASSTPRQREIYLVAIDPGHGGKDGGTRGNGLTEKRLVLDLANRIEKKIERYDGFAATLTRRRDIYLTLPSRVEIAKQKGADAFVSIHLNSAPNRHARGTEVFFVSPSGAEYSANRMLANPGKAAHDLGLDREVNRDLLNMLVGVNQQTVLQRSATLAEAILQAFEHKGTLPTRAVKQRSYQVLRHIDMPSVLVEGGFLSNRSDAKIIRTEQGRDAIAEAVALGVVNYFRTVKPAKRRDEPITVHRVETGDTLWKISRQYGTSVATLQKVNRLHDTRLRVGQELLISNPF